MIQSSSIHDPWQLSTQYVQTLPVTNEKCASPTFISTLELKNCTIPCVDILGIAALEGDERTTQIEAFCQNLHETGYVAIKAENLISLMQDVYQQAKTYFNQSDELKREDNGDALSGFNGYTGPEKNGKYETYSFDLTFQKCPSNLPQFKNVMEDYFNWLNEHMKCALQLILEYCHGKKAEVDKHLLASHNFMNLFKYRAITPDEPTDIWRSDHIDTLALTILPHADVNGLQIFKEDKWVDIQIPEGYLLLMVGGYLQHKSAGYFQAPIHQVIAPKKNIDRYSMGFAARWDEKVSLKPFEICIEKKCAEMSENQKLRYLTKYDDCDVQTWTNHFRNGWTGNYKLLSYDWDSNKLRLIRY